MQQQRSNIRQAFDALALAACVITAGSFVGGEVGWEPMEQWRGALGWALAAAYPLSNLMGEGEKA